MPLELYPDGEPPDGEPLWHLFRCSGSSYCEHDVTDSVEADQDDLKWNTIASANASRFEAEVRSHLCSLKHRCGQVYDKGAGASRSLARFGSTCDHVLG